MEPPRSDAPESSCATLPFLRHPAPLLAPLARSVRFSVRPETLPISHVSSDAELVAEHVAALAVLVPLQRDLLEEAPFLLFAAVAGFAGLVFVAAGWDHYRVGRVLANTPTEAARSVAAGRTALEGTAEPRHEPFEEPFGDGTAVVGEFEVEKRSSVGDSSSDWKTVEEEALVAPFVVEDGTGRVLVEPDEDVELVTSDAATTRYEVRPTESEPPEVAAYLREHEEIDETGESLLSQWRRYEQTAIPPGADVYVLGVADPRDDQLEAADAEVALSAGGADHGLVVSDLDAAEVPGKMASGGRAAIAIGLAVLIFAFGFGAWRVLG